MALRPCLRDRAAFTLLEICISITVFTFIMISVLGCWKCIANGTVVAQESAAAAQRSRTGMKTILEALTCTEHSSRNLQFYAFLADTTSGKFANLSLAARLPADFPGSGLYGDNVMRRLTFGVEKDKEGKDNLIMYQSPLLAILDDSKNTPYPITLARDVNVFMLEFWDDKENDWAVGWESTNKLPPMIRVTLGCGHSASNPDLPYMLECRTVALASSSHQ